MMENLGDVLCSTLGPREINMMAWSKVWSCLGFAKNFAGGCIKLVTALLT